MNTLCVISMVAMMVMCVGANPVDEKQVCADKFNSVLDKNFELPADLDSFIQAVPVDWAMVLRDEVEYSDALAATAGKLGKPSEGCAKMDVITDDDYEDVIDCFEDLQLREDENVMSKPKMRSFWQAITVCAAL